MSTSTPPVSRARRRHVVRLVKRVGLHQANLSDNARLTYVVGALIAENDGRIPTNRLFDACADPKLVALAVNILAVTGIDTATL